MSETPSYFDVVFRRVRDGVILKERQDRPFVVDPTVTGEDVTFFWTDGNGGCDCSIADVFGDAGVPCGQSAYELVGFELPDGTLIYP